jgi:hypothetical protein
VVGEEEWEGGVAGGGGRVLVSKGACVQGGAGVG